MCLQNVQINYPAPGWRARLDWFFAGVGQGLNTAALTRARLGDVAALEGMSDAELAAMGLVRADIPAHVFADLLT